MKIKILVIFLFALFMSFIIYKVTINNRNSVLILGDNYLLNNEIKTYDKYLYDDVKDNNIFYNELFVENNKNYSDIVNDIKNNKYVIYKNEKIYLNQLISKSSLIVINANNNDYFNKCNKSKRILNEYNSKIIKDIDSLITIINKISTSKIIFIGNYCVNNSYDFEYMYQKYNYVNMQKIVNDKENIFDKRSNKLSKKGQFILYNYVKSIK